MLKVTMKIYEDVHHKLRTVQGMMGAKTLSETIKTLAEEYIETKLNEQRKK